MSSYSDLATQIINKNGRGGKYDGLNTFLDVKQAFTDATRKFQMDQQLSRMQGQTAGAASIINNSNLYGTDPTGALQKFYGVTNDPNSLNAQQPQQGAQNIASGGPQPSTPDISMTPTSTGFTVNATKPADNSGRNEAYLSTLTPARQALIKQYADYRGDPARLRSGAGVALQAQVAQYDPNFDAGKYAQAQSFINGNWNKGDLFKSRQAIENLVQHADTLQTNFDKINNGNLLIANAAGNQAKIQTGNAEVTNAMIDARAVGTEMAKTLRGGGVLNEQEQAETQKQLEIASSPAQLHGAVQQMMHLAFPRINSALENYKSVVGKYPKDAFSPEAIAAIQKVSPDVYNQLASKLGQSPVNVPMSGEGGIQVPGQNSDQLKSLKDKYGLQ